MKLVMFDLDGTLISHIGAAVYELNNSAANKFVYAIREVFGFETDLDFSQFKGMVDREIYWKALAPLGVDEATYEEKFPVLCDKTYEYFMEQVRDRSDYMAVPSGRELVSEMDKNGIPMGLLTGNIQTVARLKLDISGYAKYFPFGLYGDMADDRPSLAKLTFQKAYEYYGVKFAPEDVVVVGDTIHDVACGKAIGAFTVAVTNRHDETIPQQLLDSRPDLIVPDLGTPAVRSLVGL